MTVHDLLPEERRGKESRALQRYRTPRHRQSADKDIMGIFECRDGVILELGFAGGVEEDGWVLAFREK